MQVPGAELFGVGARLRLGAPLPDLPVHSREAIEQELATLDFLEAQIESAEQRLEAIMKASVEADLLRTLPGIGKILSMVLMLEIGEVDEGTPRLLRCAAANLLHPFLTWMSRDSGHAHTAAF